MLNGFIMQLVERAIKALKDRPIVIRLSGWAQNNDRLAMREVARQLSEQTGQSYLNDEAGDADIDAENPFAEPDDVVTLPPPSHLPALISVLPTLSRPSVVILDSFDLFALHPRQSLLYCLLDTVQNCRAGSGSKGMVVIGVTARIDTINLLEKRVKSRFSGRTLRTAAPPSSEYWLDVAGRILGSPVNTNQQEWQPIWNASITGFMQDPKVIEIFRESFAMSRDMRTLGQILVSPTITLFHSPATHVAQMNMTSQLTPKTPFPQLSNILTSVTVQRSRPTFHFLSGASGSRSVYIEVGAEGFCQVSLIRACVYSSPQCMRGRLARTLLRLKCCMRPSATSLGRPHPPQWR